jgi:hypothetical protein
VADQGKWYKLHIGWDDDPHLSCLSLADQARWCKLGTYLKAHGTNGSIVLISPAKPLQNKFEVSTFNDVISCIERLPGYSVLRGKKSSVKRDAGYVTNVTVTSKNWYQYQSDFSRDRMRRLRSRDAGNVTRKRRREETLEEKRRDVPPNPRSSKSTAQNGAPPIGAKKALEGPYGG